MLDYNSIDDSDYEEESSCQNTNEDGKSRTLLLELDLYTKHVEEPSMECAAVEYSMDGGVEFMLGHKMQNRQAVLMAVKNYNIRRNAEYRVIESGRLKYYSRCGRIQWFASVCFTNRPLSINVVAPDDVAMLDYNSIDDSDNEEELSCQSTKEDEEVPNTPDGGPRLVLPAPLPIPNLDEVPSFFQQLDLYTKHVEDPSMECAAVEYSMDGRVEFMLGNKMQNRQAVLMAVKNYSIRRNAEYMVVESDWLKYYCRCKNHAGGCLWMIRVALRQNLGYRYA
ncbi:hypothetical protein PIB30_041047 [Stylosanthes scabra]|uniref:Transposase MuDR plant domain-containing protein n=1 Tax=Stylosanthes scabra TaxID=79078 RepID=A0ABU6TEJ6_9FABA|nr:hypothetical protein [Stylosanthes scabra]